MLKPKQNKFITGFLEWYINRIIGRHFYEVKFNKPDFDPNKSILLIANHFSWWDGFLLYHITKHHFKKKFYGMVLEETMKKVGIFQYLGGFSVAKNSRSMVKSLDYAAELLSDTKNLVVIFPQGKLYSNFIDEVEFGKGAVHIAAKAKGKFQYVLATTFVEGFEHKKPSAYTYLKVLNVDKVQSKELPEHYQQHYNLSKQQQTALVV